jgi:redox-sensitive bicupin YhaK (pirin superfamily)
MIQLAPHAIGPGFTAASLRGHLLPMGHVLNVDHFHMRLPTFPPHPHAGFSAVTYMLPWSGGAFTNRDSAGDRSRIGPGALHWTRAGAGMMHEEVPELPGQDCEGLQIFVKLPQQHELAPPRAYHLDVPPRLGPPEAEVRVLGGAFEGVEAPVETLSATTLVHLHLQGSERTLSIPGGQQAFALVLAGSGRIAGADASVHAATALPAGPVVFGAEGRFDVLVGWSPPLPGQVVFQGPFAMFDAARITDAMRRYRAGGMGSLAASF